MLKLDLAHGLYKKQDMGHNLLIPGKKHYQYLNKARFCYQGEWGEWLLVGRQLCQPQKGVQGKGNHNTVGYVIKMHERGSGGQPSGGPQMTPSCWVHDLYRVGLLG